MDEPSVRESNAAMFDSDNVNVNQDPQVHEEDVADIGAAND